MFKLKSTALKKEGYRIIPAVMIKLHGNVVLSNFTLRNKLNTKAFSNCHVIMFDVAVMHYPN